MKHVKSTVSLHVQMAGYICKHVGWHIYGLCSGMEVSQTVALTGGTKPSKKVVNAIWNLSCGYMNHNHNESETSI